MQVEFNYLSDTRGEIIEQIVKDHRKRKHNLRDVMDCILKILRTGGQWRNPRHPRLRWQIVYYSRKCRFDLTREHLNSKLNKIGRKRQRKQETPALCVLTDNWLNRLPYGR